MNQRGQYNTQACAACKQRRKRCHVTCELAPYFPASRSNEYQNAQKLFGVSNIQKLLARVKPCFRKTAADSILIEANARKMDPRHGCIGIMRALMAEIESCHMELQLVNQKLSIFREKEEIERMKKNPCNESEPIIPPIPPHVMGEIGKLEIGYLYMSNLEDNEEKPFEINLVKPIYEFDLIKGEGETSSAAASKAKGKQSGVEKNAEDEDGAGLSTSTTYDAGAAQKKGYVRIKSEF